MGKDWDAELRDDEGPRELEDRFTDAMAAGGYAELVPSPNEPQGAPDLGEWLAAEDHPDDLACGCDLQDPHERWHHEGGRGRCSHPECAADQALL